MININPCIYDGSWAEYGKFKFKMKRSTKTISIIIIFFLIIAIVIIGRTMIGNHFKKNFSKRPPPGIIVTEVIKKNFHEKIETFGTAISKKSKTFKIKKDDLFEDLKLKNFVKKGEILIVIKKWKYNSTI